MQTRDHTCLILNELADKANEARINLGSPEPIAVAVLPRQLAGAIVSKGTAP